jgi:flagellar export protein FliJ
MKRLRTYGKVIQIQEWKIMDIQVEINRVNAEMESCTMRLLQLEEGIEKASTLFAEQNRSGTISAEEFSMYCGYFTGMFEKTMQEMKAIEAKRLELQNVRDLLVEVYREKKLVENLKDRLIRKERVEEAKKERKEVDFLSISRRLRK